MRLVKPQTWMREQNAEGLRSARQGTVPERPDIGHSALEPLGKWTNPFPDGLEWAFYLSGSQAESVIAKEWRTVEIVGPGHELIETTSGHYAYLYVFFAGELATHRNEDKKANECDKIGAIPPTSVMINIIR